MNPIKRPSGTVAKPGAAVTFSVRLWRAQLEMIHQAAQASRMTPPDLIMALLMPACADILGIELPRWPEFKRRPFQQESVQDQAAKALGISTEDFVARVTREAADRVLASVSGAPAPSFEARRINAPNR